MFAFDPAEGGSLGLDVRLDRTAYANISFFDDRRQDILLHVSLRRDEGVAVFNRRPAEGWQAERPVPLPATSGRLEFSFEAGGCRVELDGAVLFDLDPGEAPDLDAVAWHEEQGGFDLESLAVAGGGNDRRRAAGGLVHVAPFGVEGWALDRALAGQVVRIAVSSLAEGLTPILLPRPDLVGRGGTGIAPLGVELALPGRIWRDLPPGEGVEITLTANGRPAGATLHLDRAMMAQSIDLLLCQPGIEAQAELPMLAVEHVIHGGFAPGLSPQALAALGRIAATYGLTLDLDLPPPPAALAPAEEPDPAEAAFLALVTRLRADPGLDLARALEKVPPLPPEARVRFYRMATEMACRRDGFSLLAARARAEGLVMAEPVEAEPWARSTALPWLLAAGRFALVRDTLWQVAGAPGGWISTAAVGHVIRTLAGGADPAHPPALLEEVTWPFLDLIARRSQDYWGRSTCTELARALLALIEAAPRLPSWVPPELLGAAVKGFALSPGFWALHDAALAEGRLALRPELLAARLAFDRIAAHLGGQAVPPADLEAALALFDRAGAPDAARLRREVLGPLGLAAKAEALPALMARAGEAGPAALRAAAFPADPPLLSDEDSAALAPLLAETITRGHDVVSHTARPGLAKLATGRMTQLLAQGDGFDPAGLAALMRDLTVLCDPRETMIGLGLGLAFIDQAARDGHDALCRAATQALRGVVLALPADLVEAARAALPVQAALQALTGAHPDADPGLTARLAGPGLADQPPLPAAPEIAAPPLTDALVLVISCRPYLTTRIPVLERAWLHRLDALGIPWVVAVGGADGPARREGRILHLPAPDDYEGLPQKVLAAFDWVRQATSVQHVLKIDDDCFLDVEAFFPGQAWRKHPYWGRKLTRERGQMDRAWHQGKSTSARGRLELDRSPEPSTYCDGGSGYVLARPALHALAQVAATREGQKLIQTSFMEDKLVGDLLARAGIAPEDEDHLVAVFRRGRSGATPVSVWSNSFLPSAASPVHLAHLDTVESQDFVAGLKGQPVLWPKKLWPTYAPTKLVYNSNMLELVSPVAKMQTLARAPLAVVATLRNEMFMLPHFLDHYRKLGVEAFLIADNLSDDGTLDHLLAQPDVAVFSVDSEYRVSTYGVAWQQAILGNLRVGRWSLVADADELLVPGEGTLTEALAEAEAEEADAFRLFMLDLYPEGPLSQARFQAGPFAEAAFCDRAPFLANWPGMGPFGDQPTWTSALRHRLIAGSRPELFVAQKVALMRYQPWMRLSAGLHYAGDVRLARREMIFAHFKYNAEFAAKARAEVARRQHFNDAEEYRRYLAVLQEGREVIHDPAVSVRWTDCPDVRRILGASRA